MAQNTRVLSQRGTPQRLSGKFCWTTVRAVLHACVHCLLACEQQGWLPLPCLLTGLAQETSCHPPSMKTHGTSWSSQSRPNKQATRQRRAEPRCPRASRAQRLRQRERLAVRRRGSTMSATGVETTATSLRRPRPPIRSSLPARAPRRTEKRRRRRTPAPPPSAAS